MEVASATPAQVTKATLSRIHCHFSNRAWATGIAIVRCEPANSAGVLDEHGSVTVDAKQIEVNQSRPRRASSREFMRPYARVAAKLDQEDVRLYILVVVRDDARRLAALVGEAIVWGNVDGVYVIDEAGNFEEIGKSLSVETIPTSLTAWWRRRTSALAELVGLTWCCTGPGDYRAWLCAIHDEMKRSQ